MTYEDHRIIAVAAATGRIGCVLLVGTTVTQCRLLFAGKATISMAREVYDITDPVDRQMRLF